LHADGFASRCNRSQTRPPEIIRDAIDANGKPFDIEIDKQP
jgi:hypothetical protein